MDQKLLFLPVPRKLEFSGGSLALEDRRLIVLAVPSPAKLFFAAERFQAELKRAAALDWLIHASTVVPADQIGLRLEIDPIIPFGEQGYRLLVGADGLRIQAKTEAGIFYGVCTLIQLLGQCGKSLPCLVIEDWPDFPARGVMLDVSRDKVPTMDTLYELVDRLAGWKINQVQLYIEHTFAYRNHPVVWQEASPLTGQEILELDAFCRQRCVELVPNQNSFGHMERWLRHTEYAALAETLGEFDTPWGKERGPFSLAPANPGSLRLVQSLYDELLPHFTSRMINVGCDETFDIGAGQSGELCAERGVDRVMFDYLMALKRDIDRRGLTMQFWADILVHHPHLLAEMPKNALALIWNYEASQSFEQYAAQFEQAGMPFYVCPGTSSWNSLAGRVPNALANNLDAARSGLAHRARGYLNTDWGDNGHWQTLPISLPGFAAGAAYSWCVETNQDIPVDMVLSRYGFEDESEVAGEALVRLGNVYRLTGMDIPNSSALFWLLQMPLDALRARGQIPVQKLETCLAEIDAVMGLFRKARIQRADADLIGREIQLTGQMIRHACLRGQLLLENSQASKTNLIKQLKVDIAEWLQEYRRVWLERNRPGGLRDSAGRLERLSQEFMSLDK